MDTAKCTCNVTSATVVSLRKQVQRGTMSGFRVRVRVRAPNEIWKGLSPTGITTIGIKEMPDYRLITY
jgi:hypothetical protein